MNNVDTALEKIRKAGFTLIDGFNSGQKGVEMDVELEEFLKLPLAAVPVVFFSIVTFDDSDLQYTLEDPRSALERYRARAGAFEKVDLTKIMPELKKYQAHMGTASFMALAAPLNGVLVKTFVSEPWYEEINALISEAEALAEEQADRRREQQKAKEAAKLEGEVRQLRSLLEDPDFIKLAKVKKTAQRTLVSVAAQKHPVAAAAVGEQRLKELVAELRDQLVLSAD